MNDVYREIEQHIPHLRRYARAIARNAVVADDLVQESVTRALAKSHLFKPGTNLRAWLFTIMHNQHATDMRRSRWLGVTVDIDDAAPALATRQNQETGLMMNAIHLAMQGLPDDKRQLIESVALEGKSYEDVARSRGLPVGTVKSRISRGRSQLRAALEGHYLNEKHARQSAIPAGVRSSEGEETAARKATGQRPKLKQRPPRPETPPRPTDNVVLVITKMHAMREKRLRRLEGMQARQARAV